MAAPRRRNLVTRRRRMEDEGEDDGSVATETLDDSQSEPSIPSDVDEDADADDSDLSDVDGAESAKTGKAKSKSNGAVKIANGGPVVVSSTPVTSSQLQDSRADSAFAKVADTEAMMNGLKISESSRQDEAIDFDAIGENGIPDVPKRPQSGPPGAGGHRETLAERRRREHEEYKKKRDSDPAFIPNRGSFFMHDSRSSPGQNGFRPFGRGRGRGRGDIGGPFSPANLLAQADEATNSPWKHDLHEMLENTVIKPIPQSQNNIQQSAPSDANDNPQFIKPVLPASKQAPVRSYSRSVLVGNVQIRVALPGMKEPIVFHGVPVKQHTRLPNHRPPLRRDKPVRVSLPDRTPQYIFPSVERSFIFIPRALRPNQQGFGRGRGRAGFGSYGGGYTSRRTSAYGGSVYAPSVAMSRRSSLAREVARDTLVSPAGSVMSRPPGPYDMGKPVVRLPPGSQQHSGYGTPAGSVTSPGAGTPIVNMPPPQNYPLPQKPTFRENWTGQIPMHQPRPQKTVSVAGIESPASLTFQAPPQQEQQPFQNQLPAHLNGTSAGEPPTFYPHTRQLSYPSQASTGTPLSNIPERAIHAPAFQPYQQPGFHPQSFPAQGGYYYPQPANGAPPQFGAGMPAGTYVPMLVQNSQQGQYVVPAVAPQMSAVPAQNSGIQPAMVAHEQNGMVYYYDPSQLYTPMEGYAPTSYAMPGIGGVMTPSPDGYYYPQVPPGGAVYYQPQ